MAFLYQAASIARIIQSSTQSVFRIGHNSHDKAHLTFHLYVMMSNIHTQYPSAEAQGRGIGSLGSREHFFLPRRGERGVGEGETAGKYICVLLLWEFFEAFFRSINGGSHRDC